MDCGLVPVTLLRAGMEMPRRAGQAKFMSKGSSQWRQIPWLVTPEEAVLGGFESRRNADGAFFHQDAQPIEHLLWV